MTKALLPDLATALREGLKPEGIDVELAGNGAPIPSARRIRVEVTWNKALQASELHLYGFWTPPSDPDSTPNAPRAAYQRLILRDRGAVAAVLNEQGLALARYMIRGPKPGDVEVSGLIWVPAALALG